MKESKLVILGAGSVGKTSLVLQFLKGFFSSSYHPTIEDCYTHTMQLPNGLFHSLEILDTAGSHPFPAMRELSIKSGKAFVIVFAVNLQDTYYEAQEIWKLVERLKGTKNIPVVVVGNKVDLDDERQIQYEDAKTWVSTSMANATYLETSAKYNINVKELFKQLLVCTYGFSAEDKQEATRRRRSTSRLGRTLSITGGRVGRIRSVGDLLDIVRRRSSFGLNSGGAPSAANSDQDDTGSDDNLEKRRSCDQLDRKPRKSDVEEEDEEEDDIEDKTNGSNAGKGKPEEEGADGEKVQVEGGSDSANDTSKEKEKKKQIRKLLRQSQKRKQHQKQYSVSCSALPDEIGAPSGSRGDNHKCVLL